MLYEEVVALLKSPGVSYSRPVDLRTAMSDNNKESEKRLVRALQYHQCTLAACLQIVNRQMICKHQAPFGRAPLYWINKDSEWGPKRRCAFLNSWNLTIMRSICANHNAHTLNTSALLARRLAFIQKDACRQTDLNKLNKKLIQSCTNSLTCN